MDRLHHLDELPAKTVHGRCAPSPHLPDADSLRGNLEAVARAFGGWGEGRVRVLFPERDEWTEAEGWGNHHLGTTRMAVDPRRYRLGGVGTLQEGFTTNALRGPDRISPFLIPMGIPNVGAGQVAISFGPLGPNFTTVSACATGGHAIGEAMEAIVRGQADLMLISYLGIDFHNRGERVYRLQSVDELRDRYELAAGPIGELLTGGGSGRDGGTTWRGRRLLRISVSNWATTPDDVDRSVAAILRMTCESGCETRSYSSGQTA